MYGLLGRSLDHSLSPQIHSLFGDYPYRLFCREKNELDSFFSDENIKAFNVTVPYKIEAYNRCDFLSETAKKIGSVNTVVRTAGGRLYGDNTDYFGFSRMAEKYGAVFKDKKVLILGSGGASLAVKAVVQDSGARKIVVVSRTGENNYQNISNHYDSDIIVNTTPVGMYPHNGERLIDLSQFNSLSCVLDLIYNPLKTSLLLDAEKLNIPHGNGLYMLVAQGLRSAELFLEKNFDEALIDRAYEKIKKEINNIILIGMPGCGKSTVGRILAEKLSKKLFDIDAEIEEKTSKKIAEIFEESGEEKFREIETKVIYYYCREMGMVVATGGGAVLKKENREAMKQNGTIIYLKKDLSELATVGRPLSSDAAAVQKLYEQRKEIYENLADFTVEVDSNPEITAERVIGCISL